VFRTWNIVDHHLEANDTGHTYWETKAIADELLRRGASVRIFSEKCAPAAGRFPGSRVYPTFSGHFYTFPDNTWGRIKNFLLFSQKFQRDLSHTQQTLFHRSLTYFPNVSGPSQLIPLIRWLMHFEEPVVPKVAVTLQLVQSDNYSPIYRRLWAVCPARVKRNLALTARSTNVANQYYRILGVRPRVLPSPLGPYERRAQIAANVGAPASNSTLVVSFMAGGRPERGVMLIPEVVKLCKPLKIRFFIQAKNEGCSEADFRLLTDLGGLPNVELHVGPMERDAYYDAIARSIVLIPYVPSSYQWRTSGVYGEAKFLGAPVMVAAGSWIAEEVKRLGNGLVFEERTATAMKACIETAQSEITDLRARAIVYAKKFSAENGPDRCVDAIESLFGKVNS
jgi:glycosyltransferase involved in cell wall biosynthesis